MKEIGYVIYDKVYKEYLTGWSAGSESLIGAKIYKTESKALQIMQAYCRRAYRSWDDFEIKQILIELK